MHKTECPSCHGEGSIDLRVKAGGEIVETIRCPDCDGTGMTDAKTARAIEVGTEWLRRAGELN